MPAPERAAFWTQVVRTDNALEPIRTSHKFLDLDAQLRPYDRTRGSRRRAISMTSLQANNAWAARPTSPFLPTPETTANAAPPVASRSKSSNAAAARARPRASSPPPSACPPTRTSSLTGELQEVGATELYHVPVDADGLLTVQVQPLGFGSRLSLLDGQGQLLIQSEASSPENPDDRVALHVTPGDYFLMVQDLTGGGSFQLATSFSDATAPSQPLSSVSGSYSVAVADFTGDNDPDVVIADFRDNQVLVYLGLGDGTFQPPVAIPVGLSPVFVTTADLTGNGIQDIITANLGSNDVSILMGNGDGTFQPAIEVPAGQGPSSVAVGDFYGDGQPRPGRHRHGRKRRADPAGQRRRHVHPGPHDPDRWQPLLGDRGRLLRQRPTRPGHGGLRWRQPDHSPGPGRRHLRAGPAARGRRRSPPR